MLRLGNARRVAIEVDISYKGLNNIYIEDTSKCPIIRELTALVDLDRR